MPKADFAVQSAMRFVFNETEIWGAGTEAVLRQIFDSVCQLGNARRKAAISHSVFRVP